MKSFTLALTVFAVCLYGAVADYEIKVTAPDTLPLGSKFPVSWETVEQPKTGLFKIPEKISFVLWNSTHKKPCCGSPVQGIPVLAENLDANGGKGETELSLPDHIEISNDNVLLFVKVYGFENGKGANYRGFISNPVTVPNMVVNPKLLAAVSETQSATASASTTATSQAKGSASGSPAASATQGNSASSTNLSTLCMAAILGVVAFLLI